MANVTYNAPQKGAANSTEYSGDKNASVPANGLYRHEASGQEAFIQGDPLYGNAQAQAFSRLGFVFVRDLEPGDVKTLPELHAELRDNSDVKGLAARMEKLEADAIKKTELEKEVAELRAQLAEKNETKKEGKEVK